MLKNPTSMKEILCRQYSVAIFTKFLLLHYWMSLLVIARALVDELGMIRNQMGIHNKTEMVTVQGAPCAPTPY
jgi:hypothetical protein